MDKENSVTEGFLATNALQTPHRRNRKSMFEFARTPLQDVTNPCLGVANSLHKNSQEANGLRCRNKSAKVGRLFDIRQDDPVTEETVNGDLRKKLETSKQEYEEKLKEHSRYIATLEENLLNMGIVTTKDKDETRIKDIKDSNETNESRLFNNKDNVFNVVTTTAKSHDDSGTQNDRQKVDTITATKQETDIHHGDSSIQRDSPVVYIEVERTPNIVSDVTQNKIHSIASTETQTEEIVPSLCLICDDKQTHKTSMESQTENVVQCMVTQTDIIVQCTVETQTSTESHNSEAASQVGPVDAETNTPSFPIMTSQETCVTPKKYVDREMITSPECLFLGRPSDMGLENINDVQLRNELEVACVSNTLLRNEIEQIQVAREGLERELGQVRQQLQLADEKRRMDVEQAQNIAKEKIESAEGNYQDSSTKAKLLQDQLKTSEKYLEALSQKHSDQVQWFKEQMSSLQQDLVMAYKQKKEETESLRISASEYKQLYHASHEKRVTLEKQLKCFTDLQQLLSDNTRKAEEANQAMNVVRDLIVSEKASLEQKRQSLEEEDRRLSKKRDEVEANQTEVASRAKQITLLEEKCSQLTEQCHNVEEKIKEKDDVNAKLQNAYEKKEAEHHKASEEMAALQKVIQTMETCYAQLENQMLGGNKKNDDAIKELCEKVTEAERERDRMTSEVENKNMLIRHLEGDLSQAQSWHKQLCEAKDQVHKMQQMLSENQDFHEAEMAAVGEELAEIKVKRDEVKVKYEGMKVKCKTLLTQARGFETQFLQTRERCKDLENELHYTKSSAHLMLLQQNGEIAEAKLALDSLFTIIDAVHGQLQVRVKPEDEEIDQSLVDPFENNPTTIESDQNQDTGNAQVPKSFLSTVMATLTVENSAEVDVSEETQVNDVVVEEDRRLTIGSTCSAFTRIQPEHAENSEQNGDQAEDTVTEEILCESQTEATTESTEEMCTISDQVSDLHVLMTEVVKLFKQLDANYSQEQEQLHIQIKELTKENELANKKITSQKTSQEDITTGIEKQLRQAESTEKRYRQEIDELRVKVTEQMNDLERSRRCVEEQAMKIANLSDNSTHTQSLEEKLKVIKSQIEVKSTENSMLRERLENTIATMNESGDDQLAKYARENYMLRAEMNKLRFEVIENKEEAQELAAKANNRQRTMQHNMETAEKEIIKLDDTIERLRQVLRKHYREVREWPELGSLWMEIIYDNRNDDREMAWPLDPLVTPRH